MALNTFHSCFKLNIKLSQKYPLLDFQVKNCLSFTSTEALLQKETKCSAHFYKLKKLPIAQHLDADFLETEIS